MCLCSFGADELVGPLPVPPTCSIAHEANARTRRRHRLGRSAWPRERGGQEITNHHTPARRDFGGKAARQQPISLSTGDAGGRSPADVAGKSWGAAPLEPAELANERRVESEPAAAERDESSPRENADPTRARDAGARCPEHLFRILF